MKVKVALFEFRVETPVPVCQCDVTDSQSIILFLCLGNSGLAEVL